MKEGGTERKRDGSDLNVDRNIRACDVIDSPASFKRRRFEPWFFSVPCADYGRWYIAPSGYDCSGSEKPSPAGWYLG